MKNINQVGNQVRDQVGYQVRLQVRSQVSGQVWNQVLDQVRNQVEGTLCIETWNAAIRAAAHSIDLAAEMDFYAAAELDYTGVEDEA